MEKTDLQGVIQSPEFPRIYPDQAECDWKIIVPLGYQIELTFTNLTIGEGDDVKCPYDYVKVHSLQSNENLSKYCFSTRLIVVAKQRSIVGKLCLKRSCLWPI